MFKPPKCVFEKSCLSWDLSTELIIYKMTALLLSYQITCREDSFCHLSTLKAESQHTAIVGGTTYLFQSTWHLSIEGVSGSALFLLHCSQIRCVQATRSFLLPFLTDCPPCQTGPGSTGNCHPLCLDAILCFFLFDLSLQPSP